MITNELFEAGLAHGGGTYAVSLKFSSGSSEEISSAVESMARVTGNSALAGKNAPPHLTLGMFHVSGSDVPVLLKSFSEFAESQRFPIEIEFGGIDGFLTKVIFLSLKSGSESEKLVRKLNAALHGIFLGHFEPGGNRNYLPERFFSACRPCAEARRGRIQKGDGILACSSRSGKSRRRVGFARAVPPVRGDWVVPDFICLERMPQRIGLKKSSCRARFFCKSVDTIGAFAYTISRFGGVAHLARAFEWHSKGSRFKSDRLHQRSAFCGSFFLPGRRTCVFFSVRACSARQIPRRGWGLKNGSPADSRSRFPSARAPFPRFRFPPPSR